MKACHTTGIRQSTVLPTDRTIIDPDFHSCFPKMKFMSHNRHSTVESRQSLVDNPHKRRHHNRPWFSLLFSQKEIHVKYFPQSSHFSHFAFDSRQATIDGPHKRRHHNRPWFYLRLPKTKFISNISHISHISHHLHSIVDSQQTSQATAS
jgi:hypothetical protein